MAGEVNRADPGAQLVAIEGIDGSGKTTLAAALADNLARRGIRVARTASPATGRPAGCSGRSAGTETAIRGCSRCYRPLTATTNRHSWRNPQESALVISDRYYLSGLAYHAADGIDQLLYQQLNAGIRRP